MAIISSTARRKTRQIIELLYAAIFPHYYSANHDTLANSLSRLDFSTGIKPKPKEYVDLKYLSGYYQH